MRSVEERQAWRDRCLPVGMDVRVHNGTRATVPATVVANTGVMVKVRLRDGTEVFRYDHAVFAPEATGNRRPRRLPS